LASAGSGGGVGVAGVAGVVAVVSVTALVLGVADCSAKTACKGNKVLMAITPAAVIFFKGFSDFFIMDLLIFFFICCICQSRTNSYGMSYQDSCGSPFFMAGLKVHKLNALDAARSSERLPLELFTLASLTLPSVFT